MSTAVDNDTSLESLNDGDRDLAALAKSLAGDPKTRKEFLRLVKQKHPDQPIPELDVEEHIAKVTQPMTEQMEKMQKELLMRDMEKKVEGQRSKLREDGYSAEEIASIEKLMVEKQIPSHETAANYFKMEKTLATPTPSSLATQSGVNRLPIDKTAIKEAGGIRKWSLAEAFKAADEIKSGRVRLQ